MNEDISLTENDIIIMSFMYNIKTGMGLSKAKGITIDEIAIKANDIMSTSKVRDGLNKLVACGFVEFGIKKGKKKTYVVTVQGIEFIKNIKQSNIDLIKEEN